MNSASLPPAAVFQPLDELIADYVRGTSSAEQRAAIEQRQAGDAAFAALIQQERALQSYYAQVRAAAAVPATSFAALAERLQRPTLLDRIKSWFVAPALQPTWAGAAALAVLVVVVGFWRAVPPVDDSRTLAVSEAPTYQTLTTADPATPAGAEWRLVFTSASSGAERSALLSDFGLEALSTPDAMGSLWVRSAVANTGLAERLRRDPRLMVVQAVSPPATP